MATDKADVQCSECGALSLLDNWLTAQNPESQPPSWQREIAEMMIDRLRQHACIIFFQTRNDKSCQNDLTYWRCQLFDNEADARKNFG